MKRNGRFARYAAAWLLMGAMLTAGLAYPAAAYAAAGDPVLRFELTTEGLADGLKEGDSVRVQVTMKPERGAGETYPFYGAQLDLDFDNSLFEVSELKTSGLKRPDGENWKGSWSCGLVPGKGEAKRIRVLCSNLGLMPDGAGGVANMDLLPAGELTVASFLMTSKKAEPGTESAVTFQMVETIGSDLRTSDNITGEPLRLKFQAADSGNGGGSSDGSNESGDSGGGNGGGSHGGSGGKGESSSAAGTGGGTDGSASKPSDKGNDAGQTGSKPAVRFEELTDMQDGHWASDSIRYLVEKGIVSGNEQKQFQPDKAVTRAEFAQMAAAAFGYTDGGESVFSDVTADDWYCKPVMALYQAGIVSGIGDGLFGAEAPLSRQDLAVILDRIRKDQNLLLPYVREDADFSDEAQIEDYAQRSVWELYATGIMSGTDNGAFAPLESSTRAQVATVLTKMITEREGR